MRTATRSCSSSAAPPARSAGRRGAGARALAALALLGFVAGTPPARAGSDLLVSDRPWFTESPYTVLRPRAQFEGGGSVQSRGGVRTVSGPEFMLRLGVLPRAEFRLKIPDYLRVGLRRGVSGRLGETYLGAKIALGRQDGPPGLA